MSAIAALCKLICAVILVSAATLVNRTVAVAQVAQLPSEVAPQEFGFGSEPDYDEVQIQDRQGSQQQFSLETPAPTPTPDQPLNVLEVLSDRQEYNEQSQVVTASGNVVVRFQAGVLTADQLQINLNSKLAIAKGNVALQRGGQVLQGEEFQYFFVQNRGSIQQAQGEVSPSRLDQTFREPVTAGFGQTTNPTQLLNERLFISQPLSNIRGEDGVNIVLGSRQPVAGRALVNDNATVDRIRFQAGAIEFVGDRWEAKDVYITNDPFSPPELQLYAKTATFQKVDDLTDELITTQTRLLVDQNISLPIFPRNFRFGTTEGVFSQFSFGFDDEERGGFFIQRRFTLYQSPKGQWILIPQYLAQKALFPDTPIGEVREDDAGEAIAPGVFALTSQFNYSFNPRVFAQMKGSLASLNLEDVEDKLKLNLRVEQQLGNLANPLRISQEFNYRDRLFNGSLGFQRVQRSLGLVVRSPQYRLGDSGFTLNAQGSIQNIDAITDRPALLDPGVSLGEVNLTRFQGAIDLNHFLPIWRGTPLPATRFEGLRYSPQPIVPYLSLVSGVRGVAGSYSSGDRQTSVSGSIGIRGQLGHFSRNSLDYTGFNLTYSQGTEGTTSPFLFDRDADRRTLEFGITQQIYGPFRAGFQTAINLDSDEAISTDYFVEYTRRTHGILLRYNPVLEIGSINFKINNFNWQGSTDPFVTQDIRPVIEGVIP